MPLHRGTAEFDCTQRLAFANLVVDFGGMPGLPVPWTPE